MANEEQIGFHKGAISTLVKERQEFVKTINIVDSLLAMHVEALKKLGVDVTKKPASSEQGKKTAARKKRN